MTATQSEFKAGDGAPSVGSPPARGRTRLALALDLDDPEQALSLMDSVRAVFAVAKVGLQLFTSAGPPAVGACVAAGHEVFLDLKLHDIPTTVERAARAAGRLGATYLTVHAAGGPAILDAAVRGFEEGSLRERDESRRGGVLAVTVLTSEAEAPPELIAGRAGIALEAGCYGVVCAGSDVAQVRQVSEELFVAVPGIRPAGAGRHEQARASTPRAAVLAGASLLVLGRSVTEAPEPASAAQLVAAEVAEAEADSAR